MTLTHAVGAVAVGWRFIDARSARGLLLYDRAAMSGSFTIFDHTADAGIRACATTKGGLIQAATDGLYALIGTLVTTGDGETVTFELTASDSAFLLRDYLAEVLILFECERRIVSRATVERFDDTRLSLVATSHRVDCDKSEFHREVKAITYHELAVEKTADGFEATIIVDI